MAEASGGRHRAPDPPGGPERADSPAADAGRWTVATVRSGENIPRHARDDAPAWVPPQSPPAVPRQPPDTSWTVAEAKPVTWAVGRPPERPGFIEPHGPASGNGASTRAFSAPVVDAETARDRRPASHPADYGPPQSNGRVQHVPAQVVERPEPPASAQSAESRRPTPAIEVAGLRKIFGDHVAVDDVSFTVDKGSILGLLGPNGAGKTTTVNMLCTLLRPDAGTALVNGHDVVGDAAAVRRSIMLTGQFAALDEALTGRENLVLFGRLLGLGKTAAGRRADELLESFELTAAASRRVREYSGGMRRRIDIACGLVTAPQVVFLDEPTTGLDPRSRQEVWRLVEGLREQGVTTLLTTQYLEEADVLSDRIVVIDHGRVIADGTAAELKASIGTAFYEVTPRNPDDVGRVRHILADLGARSGETTSDDPASPHTELSISVPAPDGANALVEIVRRTTDAHVELSDVALRTPTLDEVFLALTAPGHAAAETAADRADSRS